MIGKEDLPGDPDRSLVGDRVGDGVGDRVERENVRLPILLHAHLFKNAGTTIDWSLGRSFGDAFLDHRDDQSMRESPAYLAEFVTEQRSLKALSSHWLPLPVSQMQSREIYTIAMLRDPVLRLQSVYAFERRQAVDHPGTEKARDGTLSEYVAWRLKPDTGPVIRSYQTRMLSGVFPGTNDEAQYVSALENLAALAFVGLVERYDESMVLLEALLRPVFPSLDLAYVAQNVTNSEARVAQPRARRDDIERELGPLLDEVLTQNQNDQRLYDHVAALFAKRWAALPNQQERLTDFQRRCEALVS